MLLAKRPRQNFPVFSSTYKKAMELELWRAALQRRVSIETDLARQREASGEDGHKSDYGLEELAALSRTLSTRVAAVAELVHDVFDAAREPLDGDNALEHAVNEEPHYVVAAARVVELHARLRRTTLVPTALEDAKIRRGPQEALKLRHSLTGSCEIRCSTEIIQRRLNRCIRVHAETDAAVDEVLRGSGPRRRVGMLRGSKKRTTTKPCVPPRWPSYIYRAAVEAHVTSQLQPLVSGRTGSGGAYESTNGSSLQPLWIK